MLEKLGTCFVLDSTGLCTSVKILGSVLLKPPSKLSRYSPAPLSRSMLCVFLGVADGKATY